MLHLSGAGLQSLLLLEASPTQMARRPHLLGQAAPSGPQRGLRLFLGVLASFPSPLAISSWSGALTQFLSSPPQQFQVQEPEVAVENLSPPCRRKSHEKKSSFRKAFSHKKHGSKELKRAGAAGAASPESKPHRRPSFLPLCVGGHQPSTSSSLGEPAQRCHGNRGCLWPQASPSAGLASCVALASGLTLALCSEKGREVGEGCGEGWVPVACWTHRPQHKPSRPPHRHTNT